MSFPVQTLGKCAKMIPVMIWGTVIMRKRYGASSRGLPTERGRWQSGAGGRQR